MKVSGLASKKVKILYKKGHCSRFVPNQHEIVSYSIHHHVPRGYGSQKGFISGPEQGNQRCKNKFFGKNNSSSVYQGCQNNVVWEKRKRTNQETLHQVQQTTTWEEKQSST